MEYRYDRILFRVATDSNAKDPGLIEVQPLDIFWPGASLVFSNAINLKKLPTVASSFGAWRIGCPYGEQPVSGRSTPTRDVVGRELHGKCETLLHSGI